MVKSCGTSRLPYNQTSSVTMSIAFFLHFWVKEAMHGPWGWKTISRWKNAKNISRPGPLWNAHMSCGGVFCFVNFFSWFCIWKMTKFCSIQQSLTRSQILTTEIDWKNQLVTVKSHSTGQLWVTLRWPTVDSVRWCWRGHSRWTAADHFYVRSRSDYIVSQEMLQ